MKDTSGAQENLRAGLQQIIALREAVSRVIAKKNAASCFN
jgi:hypothetical protein